MGGYDLYANSLFLVHFSLLVATVAQKMYQAWIFVVWLHLAWISGAFLDEFSCRCFKAPLSVNITLMQHLILTCIDFRCLWNWCNCSYRDCVVCQMLVAMCARRLKCRNPKWCFVFKLSPGLTRSSGGRCIHSHNVANSNWGQRSKDKLVNKI